MKIKKITAERIKDSVKDACLAIQYRYSPKMEETLKEYMGKEKSVLAKNILKILLDNSDTASENRLPMCQDTGMIVVRMSIGQHVHIEGGSLKDAVNQGVREAYDVGYLRKSIVDDPVFNRKNTKDNTPAILYTDIVDGDEIEIEVAAKGFGSENMSAMKICKPSEGLNGVRQFVLDTVKNAGPNACPPLIVGVGVGGTMDYAAVIAKKSLFREIGDRNPDERYANLEKELLEEINRLGIGPQGLGGDTTALEVFIEHFPTHIASMPVVVNINCHMARHTKVVLK
jgi:fumarate hydratase subunit alpha